MLYLKKLYNNNIEIYKLAVVSKITVKQKGGF